MFDEKEAKPSYDELAARLADAEATIGGLEKRLKALAAGEGARDGGLAADGPLSQQEALAALADTLIKLNHAGTLHEMCLFAADCIYQLNRHSYVIVSLYDNDLKAITIRNILGFGGMVDAALKIFRRDPRKTAYSVKDMTEDEIRLFTSGRMETLPGGIYSLATGKIPEKLCKAVEALLGVERICCIGFALDEQPYGGITILEKKGHPVRSKLIVEILANQISMATHRRQSKEEQEGLQAQLLQARKMESIGRLAGGVAHDFNNMLSVIFAHADLAMHRMGRDNPFYHDFKQIHTAAERSAKLTRQLLAFARKQAISPRVLDLNQSLSAMASILQRLIGEDIELCWTLGPDLWKVMMDPSQLDQILTNLCINARDAINGVGKVTIGTRNAVLDAGSGGMHGEFKPGDFVLFSVRDNGRGMDRETLANIFEPFYTTKGVGEGTGLGLATIYGIVKQNNGVIDVESEPGKGTVFRIYFPRHEGPEEGAVEAESDDIPRGQGETILVVEDEPAILAMGKTLLERLGYTVLTAGSPRRALAVAENHAGEIRLLLTDVIMPEMNGKDLAERILSIYPKIRTLYMSGYMADAIGSRGVLDKGVHFIGKPFSIREIARGVRNTLDEE